MSLQTNNFINALRALNSNNEAAKFIPLFIDLFQPNSDSTLSLREEVKIGLQKSDFTSLDYRKLTDVLKSQGQVLKESKISENNLAEFLHALSLAADVKEKENKKNYFDELKTPPKQRKIRLPRILSDIAQIDNIDSLAICLQEYSSSNGSFLRKEMGFFRIFGAEGQTKTWQKVVDAIQKRAFELVKEKIDNKSPIRKDEVEKVNKIFAAKRTRLSLFSKCVYQEQLQKLGSKNTIIVSFPKKA